MFLLCFGEIWFLQTALVQFHFISHREVRTFELALVGNQVLEPTALLSLLSYREPSAGTHGVIVFALVPRSRAPCAQQRALPVLSGVRSNANVTPRPSKYGIVQYDKSIAMERSVWGYYPE